MTHPDPLTRAVQAALDAAAKTCDRLASDPTMYNADRRKAAGQCSAAIRAIDPAEVLAKVGDGWPPIEVKARALKEIVEGISGAMNHGTWRDENGMRLKDTPEWVQFYNAITHPTAGGPQ